ncbi:MAG: hypothetical protein GF329_22720 [Candidatus Lokiarchaeota archaeon]|nr:hypothetical protein [Candidatus Lokiarchaeota archaeon]
MIHYFKGYPCLIDNFVMFPDFFENGIVISVEKEEEIGSVSRVEEDGIQIKISSKLLGIDRPLEDEIKIEALSKLSGTKRPEVLIMFPNNIIKLIRNKADRMEILIPFEFLSYHIEDLKESFRDPLNRIGSVVTKLDMREKPQVENYVQVYREKRKNYLERLKKGERKFHGFDLD